MNQQLQAVIAETQEKFRLDPTSAITHFEFELVLAGGAAVAGPDAPAHARGRRARVARWGGHGPNPVEIVLAALGTCQEITYRAYATALGIPLERVSGRARW